jgi:hypothetical protein
VAPAHLRLQPVHNHSGIKGAPLFAQHDLEGDVEEQVAEFGGERVIVPILDRLRNLMCLFEEVGR